ncbi:putative oxidoreductase [Candidatus Rhodobacter oscarellae]|uniref:Putative oxidoreductase n=1 Tax=Candidatus Rhodobacter oscarellae TaxID=1675527 RepID=A0A0J9E8P2_9RHOB|nr:SDR family NAD(P)-dependent oxidoreductase [Candidatus Rhodobacter lobularis]KMW59137.1 putative oxidoreductase [Candidatus Rhodobacter lobularis]
MTKTILITGATDGIGRLTAQMLADQGHTLLLHGRSADKLAQVAQEIPGAVTYRADLSSLEDTQKLADAVRSDHARLDVLINNAGILKTAQTRAPSGRDIRFEVNTIAPYLLTKALLGVIPQEGRIVNLSSAAQEPVDVAAMLGAGQLEDFPAYAQSKLAITIWSAELAKALPEGPSVVAVNPGSLLASKMVKEGFGIAGNDLSIGADILIRAALSEEFSGRSGQYFDNDAGHFSHPHPAAGNPNEVAGVMAGLEEALAGYR